MLRQKTIYEWPRAVVMALFFLTLSSLTVFAEEIIFQMLPKHIGLVFDGWSENEDHFVALFAIFDFGL